MNQVRIIIAAIPLFACLSGPAMAESSNSAADGGMGSPVPAAGAIDSLLNQYAGLAPGDSSIRNPFTQAIPSSQLLSSFTGSAGPMSSYFTVLGVDSSGSYQVSNSADFIGSGSGSGNGSSYGAESAAPAVASITVAHAAADSLVGAVASGIAPASAGGGASAPITVAGETFQPPAPGSPQTPAPSPTTEPPAAIPGTIRYTTTITAADATPVPIPAAAVLFGSGLAALASLRKQKRDVLAV